MGRSGLARFARRRAALKAGALEHRQRPLVGVRRRHAAGISLHRVALEQCRPVLSRVGDRRVEQRVRHTLLAGAARDHEAHDRPDGPIVDRGEDSRVLQPLVVLARAEADPTDRLAVAIGDQPGRTAGRGGGIHGPLEHPPIRRSGCALEVDVADAEERAPAPLRVATLPEQRGEIREPLWRERLDVELDAGIGHPCILDARGADGIRNWCGVE